MGREPTYYFHVSREARDRYDFPRELYSTTGNVITLDLHSARILARKINDVRAASRGAAAQLVRAGDMNAMGLIDEVLHYVAGLYRRSVDREAFEKALGFLQAREGSETVDAALKRFVTLFPPPSVLDGTESVEEYLAAAEGGVSRRSITLEEMLHLSLANGDPAFDPFRELFDDASVEEASSYVRIVDGVRDFFRTLPGFGPDNEDLVGMLASPVRAAPDSLSGQLEYIRTRWGHLLGDLLLRLLTGMDVLREETKLGFGPFTPGPPEVYDYAGAAAEVEAFSADRDWMPRAVMLARNALVWLDQLSRRSGREIRRLDQVPDEELDTLARRGFTALWLIGVWERSTASREIKRRMGNTEAEASAYSLYDYVIAAELGGEQALQNLKGRAWQRGIRLASDMVPNHTGIDSKWMAEHPGRFLTWPHPGPPFPAYSFSGPNLSQSPGVGVYLEDHYWSKSDAAVVFKRVDFGSGESRLIYHGNDGTHMPWNDTAQLDFLKPETREAVIATIIHVARMFPIIRFDAAMTLTKKHFQRLWYPEPGSGGDIPSRAGNGMSRRDFDRAVPAEFWREVVDRVAREAPDTLLLAEAFWLLEGFFVRTLGMHRVYNSAFMHMLKAEDNAGYRQTIRNTLEFDPEVLRRFVNFMSNPDEQTAIEQFGDGDKYFGVCTLMATMPGLPMFAHGQIEGLREKYGMEFRRSYWNETPNEGLVARHERDIFPLLRRRSLFSGVENFLLYDFFSAAGGVNEDVFAYSNRQGDERALVLYNNRYAEARGWVRTSAAFAVKQGGTRSLAQKCLGEGLALPNDPAAFVIFRNHPEGREYIRSCRELWEKGLYAELGAFRCHVFLDFRVVFDDGARRWSRLAAGLNGRSVGSMDAALREQELRPVRDPLHAALDADLSRNQDAYRSFLEAAARFSGRRLEVELAVQELQRRLASAPTDLAPNDPARVFVKPWILMRSVCGPNPAESPVLSWIDEWMLADVMRAWLMRGGWSERFAGPAPGLLVFLLGADNRAADIGQWPELLKDAAAQRFLEVNFFNGARWFSREGIEIMTACVAALASCEGWKKPNVKAILETAEASKYGWDEFLAALSRKPPARKPSPKKQSPKKTSPQSPRRKPPKKRQ
ncbi:MAG TPA: alpha-amylase family glycosyl hydrolase [Spirochaetia bacterium]|nr:alpha-amylase family glycosyl hydrolase [Spirochaetia bacterium]